MNESVLYLLAESLFNLRPDLAQCPSHRDVYYRSLGASIIRAPYQVLPASCKTSKISGRGYL
jgi:hypothetical protein